jgi:hypothetical protein
VGHSQISSDRYRARSDLIRSVGSGTVRSHSIDIGPGRISSDPISGMVGSHPIRRIGPGQISFSRYRARSDLIRSILSTVGSHPMDMWHGQISSDRYRARSDLIRPDIGHGRISSDRYRARPDLIQSVEYGLVGPHPIDVGHGRISSDLSDWAWSDLIRSISGTVRSHQIRRIGLVRSH